MAGKIYVSPCVRPLPKRSTLTWGRRGKNLETQVGAKVRIARLPQSMALLPRPSVAATKETKHSWQLPNPYLGQQVGSSALRCYKKTSSTFHDEMTDLRHLLYVSEAKQTRNAISRTMIFQCACPLNQAHAIRSKETEIPQASQFNFNPVRIRQQSTHHQRQTERKSTTHQ